MSSIRLSRQLLESLGFVTWEAELPEGRLSVLGRSVDALAGRPAEEILATPDPWLALVHPEDRPRVDEELRRVASGQEPRAFRVRPAAALSFDGTLRLAAARNETGPGTSIIAGLIEAIPFGAAERFEHVESVAQVGSWEWKIDEDQIVWSAELYRIFGLPVGSPLAFDTYRELLHPEDRASVEETVRQALASGEPYRIEHRVRRPDGTVRWVRGRGRVVHRDGEPVKMIGTSQDITHEVEAERERTRIAQSEAIAERKELERRRLQDIFSASPTAIAVTRGPDHTIQMANRAFRDLAGGEDVGGRSFREIDLLLPGEVMGSLLDRVLSEDRPLQRDEVSHHTLDDEGGLRELHFSFVCQPLRDGEEVYGILFQAVDVTTQVRSRKELERTARELARLTRNLARKNQELDQFAYVASHDLKAPLRGIHSLSQWIEEDLGDRLDEQSGEHLRLLRSRVRRMESLIDGLLRYSRVGRGERQVETVDVGQLVREVVDLLSPPAYATVEIGELPVLQTDRLPLRQVFHNLIGNAIKFNEEDAPRIEIGGNEEDGEHRFWIRDNGPGIPSKLQERVWGMFQTLQPRDEIEGAGMGLALVRKIVHDRGGSVELESEEGRGATFSFTWPDELDPDTESDVTPYSRGARP